MQADREQKRAALRYAASRLWFPQLEMDVSTVEPVSAQVVNITDVDVFAAAYSEFNGFQKIILDCKTRKGESPINRALWLRGLMAQIGATHGYCILRKKAIEADHRYSAARFGVTLLTEGEFEHFARANSRRYASLDAKIGDIESWEAYFSIPQRFDRLTPLVQFSRSGFWNLETPHEGVRKILALLGATRSELDPNKPEHIAIVGDCVALFAYALCSVVSEIFSDYLLPDSRAKLSDALLLKLFGGRAEYEFRNQVRHRLSGSDADPSLLEKSSLRLPDWERFVQVVRQALGAPSELSRVPLIMRELAWSFLSSSSPSPTTFFTRIVKASPQAQKLAVVLTEYIVRGLKLPIEFETAYAAILLRIA